MKHLRLLSLLLLLIVQQALWAGPRTYRQAQAIAEKLAQQMGVSITPEAKARSFSGASSSSYSPSSGSAAMSSGSSAMSSGSAASQAYYIFPYGEGRGYSIVSGDDQMPEIVAYSDKGTFDEDNMSDGCRNFLTAYKQVAEAVAQGDAEVLKLMAEKRGLLASTAYQQPQVEPLLGDIAYDQRKPYNNMCPQAHDFYADRCLTGCVATAMAQVMKYWNYPDTLKQDIPAYVSSHAYQIPAISKGEKYDWANMLPAYGSSYTQEQADAVAKLMYHCGAAVKVSYSTSASGASLDPQVFVKYFGYDPDMLRLIDRGSYSMAEWCRLLDGELTAKRPVLYSGSSSSTGHQFVCDGADGKGLYHINWGWSGSSNGYFDLAILLPSQRGTGGGHDLDGFNRGCSMIIGLQPDNGVQDAPLLQVPAVQVIAEGRSISITQGKRTSVSDPFVVNVSACFANMQPEDFNGLINVGILDEKGNYKPLRDRRTRCALEGYSDGSYYYTTATMPIEYAFPVGVTKLYEIYSTDNGSTWQPCSYAEGIYPYEVVAAEDTIWVQEENTDFRVAIQAEDDLMARVDNKLSYTLHNANSHDYFGQVYIYTSDTPDFSLAQVAYDDYVCIEAGDSTTHAFKLQPEKAGDLYLWLYDAKHGKVLGDAQRFAVAEYVAPQLKMLSKSINLKENSYERENAYFWNGDRVAMPVVDGDEAVVKYVLQNDGGDYNADIPLCIFAFAANHTYSSTVLYQPYKIAGKGAITELEYRFSLSDLQGYPSFVCRFDFDDYQVGTVDYSLIPSSKVMMIDQPGYFYWVTASDLVGYFGNASSGIAAVSYVAGGLQVMPGKGSLSIHAQKAQSVAIYSLAGQCVRRVGVAPGTTTVSLPSGIYVIAKQKVLVR